LKSSFNINKSPGITMYHGLYIRASESIFTHLNGVDKFLKITYNLLRFDCKGKRRMRHE